MLKPTISIYVQSLDKGQQLGDLYYKGDAIVQQVVTRHGKVDKKVHWQYIKRAQEFISEQGDG